MKKTVSKFNGTHEFVPSNSLFSLYNSLYVVIEWKVFRKPVFCGGTPESFTNTKERSVSMSNIQQILNVEIRRLAKKEAKEAVKPLKERIKKLHLQVRTLKAQVRLLAAGKPIDQPAKDEQAEPAKMYRVDRNRIRRIRKKMQINQTDFAKLLGVSLKTIVNWEKGHARPRQPMKAKIVALSRTGKKEIAARIQELEK